MTNYFKALLFILAFGVLSPINTLSQCLAISTYIEGSGNNKCIELFNGTGAVIPDLSQFQIWVWSNGNSPPGTPNITALPSIPLASGDYFLACHPGLSLCIYPDVTDGDINFNGDDVVEVVFVPTATVVDAIGERGVDPGTQWSGGGCSTLNSTLYSTNTNNCFDAMSDYNVEMGTGVFTCAPIDDYSGLNTGLPVADQYQFTTIPTTVVEGYIFDLQVCATDGTCVDINHVAPNIVLNQLPVPAGVTLNITGTGAIPVGTGCSTFQIEVVSGAGNCFDLQASGGALTSATTGNICVVPLPPNGCAELNGDSIFINEIHYDNSGTKAGEGVEVAGPAGTDLSCYQIRLYNGADGTQYNNIGLSGIIPDLGMGPGYGVLWFSIVGIQNGSPDGIVLYNSCSSQVVQFLSYEGTFTANNGPAVGLTSTDIGVEEDNPVPVAGLSLQLIDPLATDCNSTPMSAGFCPSDFVWFGPIGSTATPGAVNCVQILPQNLLSFTAVNINEHIQIDWTVNENENTAKYILEKGSNGIDFSVIHEVQAIGSSEQNYQFLDENDRSGTTYYKLNILNNSNEIILSRVITIETSGDSNVQIYPNPTSGKLTIDVGNNENLALQINIYNSSGKKVSSLVTQDSIAKLNMGKFPGRVVFC